MGVTGNRNNRRAGLLAASVGVGAAVLLPCGLAAADPGPAESGGTVGSTGTNSRSRGAEHAAGSATLNAKAGKPKVRSTNQLARPSHSTTRWQRSSAGRQAAPGQPSAGDPRIAARPPRLPALPSVIRGRKPAAPEPAPQALTAPALTAPGARSEELRQLITNPDFAKLFAFAAVQLGVVTAVGVLGSPPSPVRSTVPLALNGYNLVPSSSGTVKSFYGQWTYMPGLPSGFQGDQRFDVVDKSTGVTVGSFDAVVSRAGSFNYTELLVTSNDGVNVGTAAGQVPPVGSLLSRFTFGPVGTPGSRFGFSYSAMAGGGASLTVETPFGEFGVPLEFDASRGIADRTVDNRPVALGNGFRIAPIDPAAETLTAVSGLLPIYTTVQGSQQFGVFDPDGKPVGSFDALFTTTSDIMGTYTQALLVTATDGGNVGTGVGQVPPVGTVYNVIYLGADDDYLLYAAMPAPSGNVITVIRAVGPEVTDEPTLIDAVTPPAAPALSAPSGHTFIPVSDLWPVGVNGLPPREVQIQGYQRFDTYDAAGNRLGTVDAQVASQWDMFGIRSEAILVTTATDDTPGSGAVPPSGSLFNFVFFGNSGFAITQAVVPGPGGCIVTSKLLTPVGDISLPARPGTRAPKTEVEFVSPIGPDRHAPSVVA